MKHIALLGAVGILGLFALFFMMSSAITGDFVISGEQHPLMVNDVITRFFNVDSVRFPESGCGRILSQVYSDIGFTPMDTQSGFRTGGKDSLATVNFVIDRTARMGTVDMGKGKMLTNGDADGFLNLDVSAVVRIPKALRVTTFQMSAYGTMGKSFTVTRGTLTTPSVDCTFGTQNGEPLCSCVSHAQQGLEELSVNAQLV